MAELSELIGRELTQEEDIRKAVKDLLDSGIREVMVSMGKNGVMAGGKSALVAVTPPAIKTNSTVGAGDALVAGFIVGRVRGLALEDSVRLGTAAAAASVTQPGTQAGLSSEVEKFFRQIKIRGLE